MEEIWKNIPDFENYKISNTGKVYSKKHGIILKAYTNLYGYSIVNLMNGKIRKQMQVHRLVAKNFIPNYNKLPCVNHIDGNKQNNCATNLEWISYSDNQKHSYKIGLRGTTEVCQYDLNGVFIKQWNSVKEASDILNISYVGIINCCKNRYKKSGNYIWRYAKK